MKLQLMHLRKQINWKSFIQDIFIYLILFGGALIFIYPMVWMFYSSLKSNSEILTNPWMLPEQIRIENYVTAWENANLSQAAVNSVIVTLSSVALIVLCSSLAGFAFGRLKFKGSSLIFYIFLGGLMLPLQTTLIPLYAFFKSLNWLNTYQSVVFPYVAQGLPFSIFLLRAYFLNLPGELEDAARIDGCSSFGIFWKIFLPIIKPGIAIVVIFQFLFIFNEFLFALIFLTEDKVKTLPIAIFSFWGAYLTKYGSLLATLSTITIPIMIIYLIFQKQFIRGMTAGAVK